MSNTPYEIKQLQAGDDRSLSQLVDLQNIVYEGKHVYTVSTFQQPYFNNPMGDVVSFNAFHGDEMAAHYACVPITMKIEGRVVKGLLDIATVTHPNHRGKGLFKTLAQTTFDYAKDNGFEFVLGVANANSFPGYMKYFNFTFVSRLDVKFGIGANIFDKEEKMYSMHWDEQTLNWRLKCFGANYSRSNKAIYGKLRVPGIKPLMGGFSRQFLEKLEVKKKTNVLRPVNLYIGLGANTKKGVYFKVPRFIKRSPFNLIFMDLTGKLPELNKDNIFFQLIDFDVA